MNTTTYPQQVTTMAALCKKCSHALHPAWPSLFIGLMMLAATNLAVAQDYYGDGYDSDGYDSSPYGYYDSGSSSGTSDDYYDGSGSSLPSWAAPSPDYSESYDGSYYEEPYDSPFGGPATEATPGEATPPPPSRVPVDGGLLLLAAAGAGYAVRKLRSPSSSDPTEA